MDKPFKVHIVDGETGEAQTIVLSNRSSIAISQEWHGGLEGTLDIGLFESWRWTPQGTREDTTKVTIRPAFVEPCHSLSIHSPDFKLEVPK